MSSLLWRQACLLAALAPLLLPHRPGFPDLCWTCSSAVSSPHEGAGETWEIDTSYQWKGLNGDWEGFGPNIKPQASAGQAWCVAHASFALAQRSDACMPPARVCPQSGYTDIPLKGITLDDLKAFNDQVEEPLADPAYAVTLNELISNLKPVQNN